MVDIEHYLRSPYEDFGRGPTSYDCWGMVRCVMEDMGLPLLPSHSDVHPDDKGSLHMRYEDVVSDFVEVNRPECGDVLALYRGDKMVHVGVCVNADGRLRVLHTMRGRGARLDRVAALLGVFPNIKWFRYAKANNIS